MKCMVVIISLLFTLPVVANDTLKRFFSDVKTVQASFSQSVIDDAGEQLEAQTGMFYLSRPGKFRWDYLNSGQQIIADGKNVYMYDKDLEQVTVRPVQNALNQVPSMLLVDTGVDIESYFNVSGLPPVDGVEWVLLEPLQDEAGYEQLKIGFKGTVLHAIHLRDALGNDTRLELAEIKQNMTLDSSLFIFEVPEGADVLTDE